jgi:hypothetical protein
MTSKAEAAAKSRALRTFQEKREAQVLHMYGNADMSRYRICAVLECRYATVNQVLKKYGVKILPPSKRVRNGMIRFPSFWTEKRCAELARLWDLGHTCSAIAAQLQCSHNAVIGKAHRMNLTPRNSPIRRAA